MNRAELKRLGVPVPLVLVLWVGHANSIAGEPPTPFWDRFPRIVESASVSKAADLHTTIGMNAAQNDPGWGLFGQQVRTQPERTEQFRRASLKSISYYETFGQTYCYVGELPDDTGVGQTGVGQTGEAPGEKVVEIGKGRVVYLRDNLGLAFYMRDRQPDRDALLPRFRKIMDRAFAGRAAGAIVPGDGVSSRVGLTVYEQAERRRLFIDVNNLAVDPESDRIEEIGPIEFSVRLPEWLRQSDLTARALAPKSRPAVRLKRLPHDRLLVTLDPVLFYAGVVISPDRKQNRLEIK